MMIELNLLDLELALRSCTQIFGTTQDETKKRIMKHRFVREWKETSYREEGLESYIENSLFEEFPAPKHIDLVHCFHGTRTLNIEFFEQGILPKMRAEKLLEIQIDQLAIINRVPKSKDNNNNLISRASKDDSVYAYLNPDNLTKAEERGLHPYCELPEGVEDFIDKSYGDHAEILKRIFIKHAKPFVIEYCEKPKNAELEEAYNKYLLRYCASKLQDLDVIMGTDPHRVFVK